MNEISDSFERQLDYDDRHLYDGRCRKCYHPAIRRGNAWFHTVITFCQADQDAENDWFIPAVEPLANCHCLTCDKRRLASP